MFAGKYSANTMEMACIHRLDDQKSYRTVWNKLQKVR